MMDFSKFLLNSIQQGSIHHSWMEERRLEWGPLMLSRLRFLLEGRSFILCTDEERIWYERYILANINSSTKRPLLPFFSINQLFLKKLNSELDLAMVNDLLDLSFPKGFVYFYIGKSFGDFARLARSKDDSLLWLFDEQLQNSFYLSSNDKDLDFKLISLYKLLDESLDGLLFSRFSLE